MGQSRGYSVMTSPGGTVEKDTFTCSHCNEIKFLEPGKPAYAHCTTCDKDICDKPKCNAGCTPFIKKIEKREEEQYRRDQNALAMR